MTGMSGLDAIRHLRAAGSKAVLVAFTASVLDAQQEALNAGADGVVKKPYREAELLRAIGEWLGVRYVYEDRDAPPSAGGSDSTDPSSLAPLLTHVPPDLLAQLHDAVIKAQPARIEAVAREIATHSAEAAARIRGFANDFRYEDLGLALEAVARL